GCHAAGGGTFLRGARRRRHGGPGRTARSAASRSGGCADAEEETWWRVLWAFVVVGRVPLRRPGLRGAGTAAGRGRIRPDWASTSGGGRAERRLGPGTMVPAVLVTPLELHGDSATVLVKVGKGAALPAGTRFLGTAVASSTRMTMRFRTVILPDGRQARVDAEAQDEQGAFGLAAHAESAAHDDDDGGASGSTVGDVAKETATDLVTSTLGGDLAGRAASRCLRAPRGRRGGAERPAVTLPAGTRLQVGSVAKIQQMASRA